MAIECPMKRVEVKLTVLDSPKVTMPRACTRGWLTFGLHAELNEAGRDRDRSDARSDGRAPLGQPRTTALGLASLFVDVRVTQLVNGVVGAHAVLPHAATSN